jgi:hypothetical protein
VVATPEPGGGALNQIRYLNRLSSPEAGTQLQFSVLQSGGTHHQRNQQQSDCTADSVQGAPIAFDVLRTTSLID